MGGPWQNILCPLAVSINERKIYFYLFIYYSFILSNPATFGLMASLMGAMFPLPRIVYAMSSDGLIFEWMGRIHPRFQTPLMGTFFVGTLTGVLAAFLNLSQLVNMMSIGTLMAYSIVAACVLLLRYEVENEDEKLHVPAPFMQNIYRFLWNSDNVRTPSRLTASIVTCEVTLFCKLKKKHTHFKNLTYFNTNYLLYFVVSFCGLFIFYRFHEHCVRAMY